MALINIFKPKWQNPDPDIRLKAVIALALDADQIDTIAASDSDQRVRQAALDKIDNCERLQALISTAKDEKVREEINTYIERLQLQRLTNSDDFNVKEAALTQIISEELLAQVAVNEDNQPIRLLAVRKINDEQLLSQIIEQKCGREPALAALAKINTEELLAQAAKHANNRAVRAKAAERLEKLILSRHKTAPAELRDEELSALLKKTHDIATAADPEKAWHDFNVITKSWETLSPPTEHILVPEFNELGEKIKERYEAFISFDNENRQKFLAQEASLRRLNDIALAIKGLSGSTDPKTADKFKNLQNEWQKTVISPDLEITPKLQDKYSQICRNYSESQQVITKERNALTDFGKALEPIAAQLQEGKFKQTFKSINLLSTKVSEWQPTFFDKTEILERLEILKVDAEQKKNSRNADIARQRQDNLDNRLGFLDVLNKMLTDPDVEGSTKKLAEIKEQWSKQIELPADAPDVNEQFNNLINEFRTIQDDFFRVRDWQLWQNKTIKDELIKNAQDLDLENDLHLVFKKIKEAQSKWREVGPTPAKESNKLWRDFKKATDRNFNRCQEFFQELDEISVVNLGKKMAICRTAQELQDSQQWQKTASKLKDLQKEWGKIGRAPKEREDELYTSFREACDHFFNRRKEYYQELDKQRQENLARKEELCRQVDELNNSPQLEHKKAIQALQKKWKTIGPAPKDQHDTVWQRFRKACDIFYQWLDTLKPENLAQKELLCEKVESIVSSIDKKTKFQSMAKEINALQDQWRTIGPAPADQQDAIWQRFKKACDIFFTTRHDYFAQIDRQRPANEYIKEKVLKRLQDLIHGKDKGAVKEIISLQEEWPRIGQASRQKEAILQRNFTEACNNFFKNRREVFQEMDKVRRDNLKQKEALCLRLELLTGINRTTKVKPVKDSQALTLAEQLQLAFETNFVMSGAKKDSRRQRDEFKMIKQEWQNIGPVPKEHEYAIKRRYEAGCEAYYKSNPVNRKK